MNDAQILAVLHMRDQLLLDMLERERDQPPVEPFDWAEWRQTRTEIVNGFRTERQQQALATRKLRALARRSPHRVIHSL